MPSVDDGAAPGRRHKKTPQKVGRRLIPYTQGDVNANVGTLPRGKRKRRLGLATSSRALPRESVSSTTSSLKLAARDAGDFTRHRNSDFTGDPACPTSNT